MKKFLGVITALSLALFLVPSVSMASWWRADRDVRVTNENEAKIFNMVESRSNTGQNFAGGSDGGNGGDSGEVEADGGGAYVEHVGTGNGGNGGSSSDGGLITTGTASTDTNILNMANSSDTRVVDDLEDEDRANVDVRISNKNRAHVFNAVSSRSHTGENFAVGSDGGNGGDSGDVEADGDWGAGVERSGTGHGGHGGDAGVGGTVMTGDAYTSTNVVTVFNRNVTRVR